MQFLFLIIGLLALVMSDQPNSANRSVAPLAARLWILACAFLSASGWVLSALGRLDRTGYAVALAVGVVAAYLLTRAAPGRTPHWGRLRRRFRRFFPAAFFVLALLVIAGGALWPPSNFDALAYRTPRVLHWLSEGRWHWICDSRGWLNSRTCDFEWVSAPVLLFAKTDRWLFLVNAVSFLLLPGLVFSFFSRLGLSRRAAWYWMWILPAGLCFALQAGSLANDLFGAVTVLAAFDFGLRARTEGNGSNLRYSILAVALFTSAKLSNLPLAVPWLIVVFPALRSLACRPLLNLATLGLAALVSFLPTAFLNWRHCGDWTGGAAEQLWGKRVSPAFSFGQSAALLAVQQLLPPVFPWSGAWDRGVQKVLPERWKAALDQFADEGRSCYRPRELPMEEYAGIGFGVALLVLAQLAVSLRPSYVARSWRQSRATGNLWRAVFLIASCLALAVFMARSPGLTAFSRLITPYYVPLLAAPLLLSNSGQAVRARWWRALAALTFAIAFIAVIFTPARPLFPARTILTNCARRFHHPLLDRARTVYSVYADRSDALAPLRRALPSSVKVVGLVAHSTVEASLWRPFGHHRVVRIGRTMSAEELRAQGVEFVVVDHSTPKEALGQSSVDWIRSMNALTVTNIPIQILASRPPINFSVVALPANSH